MREIYLNHRKFIEYWSQYKMTENLQKAQIETNYMNIKI